jgi:hypothetical protein
MELLVVGSCTDKKNVCDCPYQLAEHDFDNPAVLASRETELANWALPAADLYMGWQHRYMMNGVNAIRRRFGSERCVVRIISAGYGLVDEDRSLVPYDATFHGKRPTWIYERAQRLGIPQALRQAIQDFEVVVFLLGKEYLLSTHPPLVPAPKQRFVFLTSKREIPMHPSSTVVSAGRDECRAFHAVATRLKGKMFELFASGLCGRPEVWNEVLTDPTPAAFLRLVEAGRGLT